MLSKNQIVDKEADGNSTSQSNGGKSSGVPIWLTQEKVSLRERLEVRLYQFISIFPVLVTFGLYTYLLIFYCGVSISRITIIVLFVPPLLRVIRSAARDSEHVEELA